MFLQYFIENLELNFSSAQIAVQEMNTYGRCERLKKIAARAGKD